MKTARIWKIDFVAGVDGCKSGWVWFKLFGSGRIEVELVSIAEILHKRPAVFSPSALIFQSDFPMDLAPAIRQRVDCSAARRCNSVFSPPTRAALSGANYSEMCSINKAVIGVSLTKQSCAIVPKIKEVDDVITPAHQSWAFEVHPEVCFWHFAGARPMEQKKKRPAGRLERLSVLMQHLPTMAECVARRPGGVGVDDLLDAAVAALTARRWAHREAARVCEPQKDVRGLRVEIVY